MLPQAPWLVQVSPDIYAMDTLPPEAEVPARWQLVPTEAELIEEMLTLEIYALSEVRAGNVTQLYQGPAAARIR